MQRFNLSPRDALLHYGYDPDEMPWWLMKAVDEIRGFLSVHREYTDATSPGAHKDAIDRVKKLPYWEQYSVGLAERAMRIKEREAE